MIQKKKVFILLFTSLIVLLSPISSVFAQETTTKNLLPDKDSLTPFQNIEYTTDGNVDHVKVKGNKKADGQAKAYHIKIDKNKGTYKVEPTDLPSNFEQMNTTSNQKGTLSTLSTTTYSGGVETITDDSVGEDLCKTRLSLSWYDYGTTISHNYSLMSYWAANPSIFGTHWYTSSHRLGSPYLYYGNQKLDVDASASYYNYDFLDDDLRTDVSHYIKNTALNNGTFDYVADWGRSGESWVTLDLDIVVY